MDSKIATISDINVAFDRTREYFHNRYDGRQDGVIREVVKQTKINLAEVLLENVNNE